MPEPREIEPGVFSFDDAADMFTFIEQQQLLADTAMQEYQRVATYGDRYVTRDEASGLWIYGVIEKSPYAEDAEAEERLIAHNRRPVRAWSVACPQGELGTIHVASILAYVTPRAWCRAEASGWQPPGSLPGFGVRHSLLRGVMASWLDVAPFAAEEPISE